MYNDNMRKSSFFPVAMIRWAGLLVIVIAALFESCTDFFSTSLAAPWAVRDQDKLVPSVTAGNVDELIDLTDNDPDLSLAVLKKIQAAVKGAFGNDKQKLQEAALQAAVHSVGLAQSVLGVMSELNSLEGSVTDIFIDAIKEMQNLADASSVLFAILDKNFDMDEADPTDLALAAMVLLAGEAKKAPGGVDNYVNSFPTSNPSNEAQLAMVMAAAAAGGVSGSLKDALAELGLI